MLVLKKGNLLFANEQYIVHQTNTISTKSAGLAAQIFKKYPYADCYTTRSKEDFPGNIRIKGNGLDQRYVINLHGQKYPGKPSSSILDDTEDYRRQYFLQGLYKISLILNLKSLAFPEFIGCGLGGGEWSFYLKSIKDFAEKLQAQNSEIKVSVYRYKDE